MSNPNQNQSKGSGNGTFSRQHVHYWTTIYGEPASKANSRRSVIIGGKPRFIRSKKALDYKKMFEQQAPVFDPLMEGDLFFACKIFYRTRRPDLDASLILDLLEGRAYKNDRQVRRMFLQHDLDKENPRTDILVMPINHSPFKWELVCPDDC